MKRIATIILLIFSLTTLYAMRVDSTTARRVAETFWNQHAPKGMQRQTLRLAPPISHYGATHLFVADSGFVIVSASDIVRPVLAYGFGHPADLDNMPPQIADWLFDYDATIVRLEEDNTPQYPAVAKAWEEILTNATYRSPKNAIAPLIHTEWDQGYPYNMLCPVDAGSNRRTVTGCVATAMAQILRYWSYPIHGKGRHAYSTRYGTLSANFDTTYYQWSLMPYSEFRTDEQRNAVATLMLHCGIAMEMSYGTSAQGGSSTYSCDAPPDKPTVPKAFLTHFDFQRTLGCRYRSNYNDSVWAEILINELKNSRPIFYSGADPSAGHAFVLDGVDNQKRFHINWGWGGGWDGYYAVGAFEPGSGGTGGNSTYTFNLSNSAVIGLIPNGVLKVHPRQVTIGVEGGMATVFVSSNKIKDIEWDALNEEPWIILSTNHGAGSGDTTRVNVAVMPNATGHPRNATIHFVQDGDETVLSLRQNECGAIDSFPYFEGFEDSLICWNYTYRDNANLENIGMRRNANEAHSGVGYFEFGSLTPAECYDQYLISPRIELTGQGTMVIYFHRNYAYNEQFEILASTTDTYLDHFTDTLKRIDVTRAGWFKQTVKLPENTRYVALHYYSVNQRTLSIDDITITAPPRRDTTTGLSFPTIPNATIYSIGRDIVIEGAAGHSAMVCDIVGRVITKQRLTATTSLRMPHRGIYIVRIGNRAQKITITQ